MRVGVIHDSLRIAGGGERVCLKTIEALKDKDYEVFLGTIEPTNWDTVESMMGCRIRPDKEFHLINLSETPLRIYMGVLTPIIHSVVSNKCDICVQTNGDVVPLGNVCYMHYLPTSICNDGSYCQGSTLLRKLYSYPYRGAFQRMVKRIRSEAIVANSLFTRDTIRQHLGRDAKVVYPPVEIGKFAMVRDNKREKSVVCCGRFSPEKNFEFVLEVARMVPQCDFAIIGTLSGAVSRAYYDRLCAMRETMGLKNVTLVRNGSFSNMLSFFASSRVFLSAKVNEPFGLSVVESMAAGMVPLVHRSGGPWFDTIDQREGLYGYSYRDAKEASHAIERMMVDDGVCSAIARRNEQRTNLFSDVEFKRNIIETIEEVALKFN